MNHLQAFIDNSVAYHLIIEKTISLKHPVQAIKRIDGVMELLKEKASVTSTTNLESLNIDQQFIKTLTKLDKNFTTLPLLLAYNHVKLIFNPSFCRTQWVKNTLSGHPFTSDDLWTFYELMDKIITLKLNYDSLAWHHPFASDYLQLKNEIKKIILDHLPNSDERKAYEQAKLLLQKGA